MLRSAAFSLSAISLTFSHSPPLPLCLHISLLFFRTFSALVWLSASLKRQSWWRGEVFSVICQMLTSNSFVFILWLKSVRLDEIPRIWIGLDRIYAISRESDVRQHVFHYNAVLCQMTKPLRATESQNRNVSCHKCLFQSLLTLVFTTIQC